MFLVHKSFPFHQLLAVIKEEAAKMVVYVYLITNATASMVTLGMAVINLVSRQNAL